MKARCKHRGQAGILSSRMARRLSQQKQAPSTATLHPRGAPGAEETPKGDTNPYSCISSGSAKKITPLLVNPLDSQLDWAADQAVKRKRGRKPKVLMGVNLNRVYHKDSRVSDKREGKSDSDTSEHGELHRYGYTYRSVLQPKQFAYNITALWNLLQWCFNGHLLICSSGK